MNNVPPTPRRYTSRPENRNNLRYTSGNFGAQRNLNSNPREKYVPREYYENAKNVDGLISEIKALKIQLYESQCENARLNDKFQQCKNKLGKYHDLAIQYKQERNDLSMKLYNRNVYEEHERDFSDDFEVGRDNNSKNYQSDKIHVTKRRNDNENERRANSSTDDDNDDENVNGNSSNYMEDPKFKESIIKLLEKIAAVNTNDANGKKGNSVEKSNDTEYMDETVIDIMATKQLKVLEDTVSELRNKLNYKKAYEQRVSSVKSEISELSNQLLGETRPEINVTKRETENNFGKHKAVRQQRTRKKNCDSDSEYNESENTGKFYMKVSD
ncbi:hypothetical protein MOUN0_A02322 [Monosporozyma unispora]|nr:hypothetical protein C6P44_005406 [Kazachstania unispora]